MSKLFDLPNGNAVDPTKVSAVLTEETQHGQAVIVVVDGQRVTAQILYPRSSQSERSLEDDAKRVRDTLKAKINELRIVKI